MELGHPYASWPPRPDPQVLACSTAGPFQLPTASSGTDSPMVRQPDTLADLRGKSS